MTSNSDNTDECSGSQQAAERLLELLSFASSRINECSSWRPFLRICDLSRWAMALVILVPGVIAFIFGFFAFRSKIKGVYFSIITQAMVYAADLLFFRNETGFGGNNGFTGFTTLLGYDITAASTRAVLCFVTALALLVSYMGLRYLMNQPYGRVLGAIRDSENRLQYLGYRTLWYKLSASMSASST